MKVAIVGGGNMGSVLGKSFVTGAAVAAEDLCIVEKNDAARQQLERDLACITRKDITVDLSKAEVVLLAVKPQDAQALCEQLAQVLVPGQLVLSIMAAISIANIAQKIPSVRSIIRCMPNLPVKIGQGMSVYFASAEVNSSQLAFAEKLLSTTGQCMRVASEDFIDASAAVSGCGPGYLFYILESLIKGSRELGFTEEQSNDLVYQTLHGSLELWRQSSLTPDVLRQMVSSKGGLTLAAISVFEAAEMSRVIQSGMQAACARAKELSRA